MALTTFKLEGEVTSLTYLLQVTDKLYHAMSGIQLATLVVIDTDCIGSYISNDHDHDGLCTILKGEKTTKITFIIIYHFFNETDSFKLNHKYK
jgi:hypothetical protein